MKLKLNINFSGYKKGTIIRVNAIDGIPVEKFWRDRLKDSAIDKCVEIVEVKKTKLIKKKDK